MDKSYKIKKDSNDETQIFRNGDGNCLIVLDDQETMGTSEKKRIGYIQNPEEVKGSEECTISYSPSNIRELNEMYNDLKQELYLLSKKFDEFKEKFHGEIEFKSIPEGFQISEKFLEQERWINNKKSLYPEETIVYTIRNGEPIFLTHSKIKEKLSKKIDELFDKREINKQDKIYFR